MFSNRSDPIFSLMFSVKPVISVFVFFNGSEEEGRDAYKALFDIGIISHVYQSKQLLML